MKNTENSVIDRGIIVSARNYIYLSQLNTESIKSVQNPSLTNVVSSFWIKMSKVTDGRRSYEANRTNEASLHRPVRNFKRQKCALFKAVQLSRAQRVALVDTLPKSLVDVRKCDIERE